MNGRIAILSAAWQKVFLAAWLLLSVNPISTAAAEDWSITIQAEMAGIWDRANVTIGASSDALDGLDLLDEPHPPRFPDRYLDLTIQHRSDEPGWEAQKSLTQRYLAEYHAPLGFVTRDVNLVLESDTRGPVSLSWSRPNSTALASHDVYIEDVSGNQRTNMRLQTFMEKTVNPGQYPFRVLLIYKDPNLVTPTPTILDFQTPTSTSTPDITPTPSPPDGSGWWILFEMAVQWKETDYDGRADLDQDNQVTENDIFLLFDSW